MKHPSKKNTAKRRRCSTLYSRATRCLRSQCLKSRLSPCPEESVQQSCACQPSVPLSVPTTVHVTTGINFPIPLHMPPGPHTSPVPSPPPISVPPDDLFLHDELSVEGSTSPIETGPEALGFVPPTPSTSDSRTTIAKSLRRQLQRRRNAICESVLGRGLKDFFVSYVVSHLTESMTSALNLGVGGISGGDNNPQDCNPKQAPCDSDAKMNE